MNQTFSKTAHRDATRATNALKPHAFVAKLLFRSFHQVSSQTDEWRLRERDEADAWRSARRVRLERGCACDDALGKNGV